MTMLLICLDNFLLTEMGRQHCKVNMGGVCVRGIWEGGLIAQKFWQGGQAAA